MRIRKLVQAEQEVSIQIGIEDIADAISEAEAERRDGNTYGLHNLLNTVCAVLRAIPDAQIAAMTPIARQIIFNFLKEQIDRYKEGTL